MVIQGICSYPFPCLDEYLRRAPKLGLLPPSVNRKGSYIRIGSQGRVKQILLYEFEETNFLEACKCLSRHFEALQQIPGFSWAMKFMDENTKP